MRLAFLPAVLLELGLDPARVAQHQAVDRLVLAAAPAHAARRRLALLEPARVPFFLGLFDDLGVGDEAAQTLQRSNAGHVDFITGEHPFKAGLFGVPSQTYYEVPLGFPAKSQSPHHGISTAAWTEAGGTTVGTVGTSTVLGDLPRGKGKITIFGAILPQPVESLASIETPHPEGLADYAVTIAGGQVLHNVLAYRAPGRSAGIPPTAGPPTTPTAGGRTGLAATGLSTVPGVLGLVLLLGVVARRRATQRPSPSV